MRATEGTNLRIPEALRENYLFRGLSDAQFRELEAMMQGRRYDGGETLLRQFGPEGDLMIILHGDVSIKTFHGDEIAVIGPGGIIGEVSLIDQEARSANAVAVGPVEVAALPREPLLQMLSMDLSMRATLMENLAKVLCARLRVANIQLDGAAGAVPR